jgi:hypothetical protein
MLTSPLLAKAVSSRSGGSSTTLAVLAATVFTVASAQEPKDVPSERDELLRRSSFVFAGTVREARASTVKLVPAGDNTVAAHVDRVVKGADTVGDFTGENVTIVLQKPLSVRQGDRFTFFTNPRVSSKNLAVEEVGHLPADERAAELKAQAGKVEQEAKDKKLREHVAQADLIVTGQITATKPLARETGNRPPLSEHEPEWWEATIQVQGVEKGKADKTVTVYYPHSRDIRWFAVPKLDDLKVKEGVFLLHSQMQPQADAKERDETGIDIKGFKILHAEDVQPLVKRELIQGMIRR